MPLPAASHAIFDRRGAWLLAALLVMLALAGCHKGGGGQAPAPVVTPPPACDAGQVVRSGRCVTPPPPLSCPGGQPPQNGVCVAPPPVSCTSAQVMLGNACLVPNRNLPAAAASLAFWENTSGPAGHGFASQPALKVVKAHYAYGDGLTGGFDGAGIQTAVLDSGINAATFRDGDGNTPRLSRMRQMVLVGSRGRELTISDVRDNRVIWDDGEHGTSVASVLASSLIPSPADPDAAFMGIAPGARVLDVPHGVFFNECQTMSDCRFAPSDRTDQAVRIAADRTYQAVLGAAMKAAAEHASAPRYINISAGTREYFPSAKPTLAADLAALRQRADAYLPAVLENGRPPASRPVFVFAAGNAAALSWCITTTPCVEYLPSDPDIEARLPRIAEWVGYSGAPEGADIKPWYLAVVGLSDNPDPAALWLRSNLCGDAAAWCIAAPAVNVRLKLGTREVMGQDITIFDAAGMGTSFAAPLVVGAMALVDQAFSAAHGSSVAPMDVRKRILDTANRTGIYAHTGDNAKGAYYGQGVLDVQAALTPQGTTTAPTPSSAPGGAARHHIRDRGLPVAGLALALPASVRHALTGARLLTLDAQGFPFYLRAADLAQAPAPAVGLVTAAAGAAPAAMRKGFGLSLGVADGWAGALLPQHMRANSGLAAADAHLAVSPLLASSLDGGPARHVALRLQAGDSTLGAMACGQRRAALSPQAGFGETGGNACLALSWDWTPSQNFGLSLRTHRLDTRDGLYRYGPRCGAVACADGSAAAAEAGLGGFARVAPGLRLGWRYWRGGAGDDGGGLLGYGGVRHSGGSLALGGAGGGWSLYLQQPLRTSGRLAVRLPSHRTPDGRVHFRSYDLALRGPRHLRLGFAARLGLGRRGGFAHLDLGVDRGLEGQPGGAHPYASLQARILW